MHIAIEGLDGVGKTSAAKLLAEKLGFLFVEKPMRFFTDGGEDMQNYLRLTSWLNSAASNALKACFYGCGNLLISTMYGDRNIVTDRHLASNYYWNGDIENGSVFDYLVRSAGIPDLTVVLYATPDIRRRRIVGRDQNDSDIQKFASTPPDAYEKMELFIKRYNMPYIVFDNSSMDIAQTVEQIFTLVKNIG